MVSCCWALPFWESTVRQIPVFQAAKSLEIMFALRDAGSAMFLKALLKNGRALLLMLLAAALPCLAQQPADYFRQNCASCHTIGGGRLTGPDLKDVGQRKDRAWLAQWLQNPKALIDAGDPYANKMLQDSRGVVMPAVGGMNPTIANSLLDLIEAESKLPKSHLMMIQR
jgi:cytochrome c551/c552